MVACLNYPCILISKARETFQTFFFFGFGRNENNEVKFRATFSSSTFKQTRKFWPPYFAFIFTKNNEMNL